MANWRNETARDVGYGDWEGEESRAASYGTHPGPCAQGQHRMRSDGHGGGRCACGATVGAEEL